MPLFEASPAAAARGGKNKENERKQARLTLRSRADVCGLADDEATGARALGVVAARFFVVGAWCDCVSERERERERERENKEVDVTKRYQKGRGKKKPTPFDGQKKNGNSRRRLLGLDALPVRSAASQRRIDELVSQLEAR